MRLAIITSVIGATFARLAAAQGCQTPPNPLFEFQVAVPAQYLNADSSGPHPVADPQAAWRAKTDTFVVQFLVDTTGRAVPPSLKVLHGGKQADWSAVRKALPHWRFKPAEMPKRCRVVQLVQTAMTN